MSTGGFLTIMSIFIPRRSSDFAPLHGKPAGLDCYLISSHVIIRCLTFSISKQIRWCALYDRQRVSWWKR